jgi:hypothetical protein
MRQTATSGLVGQVPELFSRPRHRNMNTRFTVRRPCGARFGTVWPCARDGHDVGTGVLSGWLITAVVKVVTAYSMPGDRVLLIEPGGTGLSVRRTGPYVGLPEAAWAVVRLGRGVRTVTGGVYEESGSGLGSGGLGSGLFDVVIVAAGPRTVMVVRPTSWGRVLGPRGVLAVITHTDHSGPLPGDATGALVRAARADRLRYVDHIVLLRTPLDERPGDQVVDSGATRVRAHADLHVFGRRDVG